MNKKQIHQLIDSENLLDIDSHAHIKETHISWVILTSKYAIKIKKPVEFSFLDFSSIEKRKFFCHKELELNSRISPNLYLDVIPIKKKHVFSNTNSEAEEIMDYAVQMKQLDTSREMHKMLAKNKVTEPHIKKLAQKVAAFHGEAPIIKNVFNVTGFQELFEDILSTLNIIRNEFGEKTKEEVLKITQISKDFLNSHRNLINERVITGKVKEVHGDLNARNIFIYDDPIIFDCIEFNKDLRQIDCLNEVAFLCIDLEYYKKENLSSVFYNEYMKAMEWEKEQKNREMLNYYKCYRANIQSKICLLKAQNSDENRGEYAKKAKQYLALMRKYANKIK